MRTMLTALAASFLLALPAQAQEVSISSSDSIQSVLAAQKGKRVTVRTGNQEITGQVREATSRLVVLGAVTGREFFDAVIPLDKIEAVLIRTKQ
jgi:hypothetical protein